MRRSPSKRCVGSLQVCEDEAVERLSEGGTRRDFMRMTALGAPFLPQVVRQGARRPNFIIILADDQGYADLGCYGSPDIRTPAIDRLASDGVRLTSFYAQAVCGPSRSALMTGCYPPRTSTAFNHWPKATTGLNPNETTIASLVKPLGYATMILGKWHLGDNPRFLPMNYGFDSFFGTPFSNDMWSYHPRMPHTDHEDPRMVAARQRAAYTGYAGSESDYTPAEAFPPLPLMSNNEIVALNPDQTQFIAQYTKRAVDFIRNHKEQPFLLYLAHNMPHVPLFSNPRFQGSSLRGRYGDAIQEVDDSVKQIVDAVRDSGLERDTVIVYTSDNGPWLQYGVDGGSAGPFRDGKTTQWEGGFRVPGIFYWPGQFSAGKVSSEIAANIDLLPTLASLSGARIPTDRVIDGRDLSPHLRNPSTKGPHDSFYYFLFNTPGTPPDLAAVRMERWKLHVKTENGKTLSPVALYDLQEDPGEKFDRMASNSELVRKMKAQAQAFYDDLAAAVRPIGRV